MNMHLFSIILTINMIKGTKRKLDHVYMGNFDYCEVTKVFNSSKNQLYCKTCDNKISPTAAEFDFHYTKLGKFNSTDDNFEDFFDYLDRIKSYRPVSENNSTKIKTEPPDFCRLKILENREKSNTSDQKVINITKHPEFINNNYCEISSLTNKTDIGSKSSVNCPKKVDKSSKHENEINECNNTTSSSSALEHGEKPHILCSNKLRDDNVITKHIWLKLYIEKYISKNISYTYSCNQKRKANIIEQACFILKNYKFDKNTLNFIFDIQEDKILLNELQNLVLILEKRAEFNRETFEIFLKEFDLKIFSRFYSTELNLKLDLLLDQQKKFLFYTEFSKLNRYVEDVPELLTLGGLFLDKSCRKLIFIMHIINLFAENSSSLKDSKTFVLCLISKAFNIFNGYLFDIFLISEYEIKCNKGLHNLNFFLWELNNNKRQNIKRRKGYQSKYRYKDRKYLIIIFLLYLYQHNIFLEYYNANAENVKNFYIFVNKVKRSQDCIGCLFGKYLSIATIMNDKVVN